MATITLLLHSYPTIHVNKSLKPPALQKGESQNYVKKNRFLSTLVSSQESK